MADQKAFDRDPVEEGAAGSLNSTETLDRNRNLRLTVLLTILGSLLFAVWYDYKVARPGVDQAFDIVGHINTKYNRSPSMPAMSNQDVRQALGFTPAYSIKKGEYQVEVYAWTAGLPFRSHDYYAVYTGQGTNLTFKRHYKFHLPMEELSPRSAGPQLASASLAAAAGGPNPREAVGDRWDPERNEDDKAKRRAEIERLAIPARGVGTAPHDAL